MIQNRVNSIKRIFEGIGPDSTTQYTNQEIVDLLQSIQKTMLAGIYEKTHAEHMREKDLMQHISSLAEEYGLKETELYKRFEGNMKDLGYTIVSFIKGMKGEQIAKNALKVLSYDKDVKIFYNVALEDEDMQAEYDAIVLAPYGMFVVEVKNWGSEMCIDENGILRRKDKDIQYDLAGRMSIKEALLRKYLGAAFPNTYHGMVLFPNENVKLQDEFKFIPVCCGGGISYKIRNFNQGEELTAEQIEKIAGLILSNHKEQKGLCKVRCDEIIEDYAVLMATIEAISDGSYTRMEELENVKKGDIEVARNHKDRIIVTRQADDKEEHKNQRIKEYIATVVEMVIMLGVGVVASKKINSK